MALIFWLLSIFILSAVLAQIHIILPILYKIFEGNVRYSGMTFVQNRNFTLYGASSNMTAKQAISTYKAQKVPSNSTVFVHETFEKWKRTESAQCGDKFKGYANNFAILHDVMLNTNYGHGGKGGEDMFVYGNYSVDKQTYTIKHGFFTVECDKVPQYKFLPDNNHLNAWMREVVTDKVNCNSSCTELSELTIAIRRYEYANIYFQMMDYYSAFTMMSFFKKKPKETTILMMDAFPKTPIEWSWTILFHTLLRIGNLSTPRVKLQNLVWAVRSYNTPLYRAPQFYPITGAPLLEEFRHFFLSGHGIDPDNYKTLDCNNVNVLIILRRDYVAHPNNPSGLIKRKFYNEEELLQALKQQFPNLRIKTAQMETLNMSKQLELASHTDILIAMHGAGLAHTIFLPKHASLIEFFPLYHGVNNNFRRIAEKRKIYYKMWKNENQNDEFFPFKTRIPPDKLTGLVKNVLVEKCG